MQLSTKRVISPPAPLGILLAVLIASSAHAQPTNIELFQQLAVECVAEIDVPESIILDASDMPDYLRSAVASYLIDDDVAVYGMDSGRDSLSRLAMRHDVPELRYEREGRRVARHVSVSMHFLLTMQDGRVTADSGCRKASNDVVDRRSLSRLESSAHPESQASRPDASWRRRYLEPVIMAGATAVTVLLFFSLRSKRAGDE